MLIFVATWLRPGIAAFLFPAICITVCWSTLRAVRDASQPPGTAGAWPGAPSLVQLSVIGLITAFAVLCTGAGGFTFQFYDYWLYDAQLKQLMVYPWPLGGIIDAPEPGTRVPGVAYWGYWLPAALVGRLTGWHAAYVFQYFWNVIGVMLAVLWFLRIIGTSKYRYALLFLFFGGVDLLGYVTLSPLPDGEHTSWFDYVTGAYWWSVGRGWMAHWSSTYALMDPAGIEHTGGVFFRFFGLLSFLADGPQHVLPGIVIVLTVIHDALRRATVERLFLLTSFLPLHSIFITIGAIPLLAIATLHVRGRGLFNAGNLAVGPVIVFIFYFFYRSTHAEVPSGPIWLFQNPVENWRAFALHYLCAFGLYALAAPTMRSGNGRPGLLWWYGAILIFALAPWYRLGVFSDFTTKVIIPMQMVAVVCLATALRHPEGPRARLRQRLLAALLILGAWAGAGVIIRAVDFGFGNHIPPMERVAFSLEKLNTAPDAMQTFDPDGFYWTRISRPVQYMETPENKIVEAYTFRPRGESVEDWVLFSDEFTVTAKGWEIMMSANMPLLRKYEAELESNAIGSVELIHEVTDAEGNTPDYRITFHWVSEEEVEKRGDWWPFHRWKTSVIHPEPSPTQPLSSNPYWQGTASQFALYFSIDNADPDAVYTLRVEALRFYQR